MGATHGGWTAPGSDGQTATMPRPVDDGAVGVPPPPAAAFGPPSRVRPLGTRAGWAVGLVAAVVVIEAVVVVGDLGALGVIGSWAAPGSGAGAFGAAVEVAYLSALPALLAAGIAFLCWFHRAYANLPAMGATTAHGTGWAVGAWFVPFLNLVRPRSIAGEVWRWSQPPGTRTWVLNAWWAAWLIDAVVVGASRAPRIAADTAIALELAGSTLHIASGALVIAIILRVTEGQARQAARPQPGPGGHGTGGWAPHAPQGGDPAGWSTPVADPTRPTRSVRPARLAVPVALGGLVVVAGVVLAGSQALSGLVSPRAELTEAQLASLLVTADDLGPQWRELPPAEHTVLLEDDGTDDTLAGDWCGAGRLDGPAFTTFDEQMYVVSAAEGSCLSADRHLRNARLFEQESIQFHEGNLRDFAELPGVELLGVEGGGSDGDFGQGVHALEVTGRFRIDGHDHTLHVVELRVFADHAVAAVVAEAWDRPVPTDLQRDLAQALRERVDALAE